ncbi:ABC transporter ATP-binding protein/permease [Pseudomonas fildesensis]|uniref:ABC transporter ATP-binding protein/permease n=1 Tax=Pseudomonas fildesensis TaxID=1674920 RepID=UPI00387B9073
MQIIKRFYSVVRPFWFCPGAAMAWLLLASTLGTTIGIVWVTVQYTYWSRTFYDAMGDFFAQASAWDLALHYAVLTALFVVLVVVGNWLKKLLLIHWRQRMTLRYQADWLRRQAHYRMRDETHLDNPDQRLAEDIRLLVEQTISLFLSLIKNLTSLMSFIVVLWEISGVLKFTLWGVPLTIHGYLVWVALVYAALSSVIAHWIGRPLHRLNVEKQRVEADYRASLLQVREHSEQIAFYRGERAELRRMNDFFVEIVSNWRSLMLREFKLDSFITSYFRLSLMLPLFAVLPLYIARQMTLGAVMQARGAFGYVLDAFGWFIDSYRQLVTWSATVERLWQFHHYVESVPPIIRHPVSDGGFSCKNFAICDASGELLITPINQSLALGDWLMITGASGVGKTSLLRALAGLQRHVHGTWQLPAGRRMFIPQRAYLSEDTLEALLRYPGLKPLAEKQLVHALERVGLAQLVPMLKEKKAWGRVLSAGEQQRLVLARAIVYRPVFLCMDEATSNLDERTAHSLFNVLRHELPATTVIAISHQQALAASFEYRLNLSRGPG